MPRPAYSSICAFHLSDFQLRIGHWMSLYTEWGRFDGMTQWLLRFHDINEILDSKPLTNILDHLQRIILCNNLIRMKRENAYTQENSQIFEEVCMPLFIIIKNKAWLGIKNYIVIL